MGFRTVYGNTHSENGWQMVDEGSCVWIKVPGADDVNLQIREGQPAAILGAYAADYNQFVEPLRDRDSACWTPGNSVGSSNHLSGTALDLNWDSHPFRVANAGYNQAMMNTMKEILDFYEDTVFWANNWNSPKDAMHHQMGYDTFGAENVDRVQSFIDRKIRSDGFSTFRRGGIAAGHKVDVPQVAPTADGVKVLAEVMGNTVPGRYAALFPAVSQCLQDCGATTVKRIAMWCAQIGEESGGLRWMEEIASGAEYEGRGDLGNTQPGDGVRFKGRGPIQVTGRHNYTNLSQWAYSKQLVPSPTFFVDQPAQLSSDKYGFVGVTWYWTTQRELNRASDDSNVLEATHMINGGEHGLADRRSRYERAINMGGKLLSLLTGGLSTGDDELSAEAERMIREIHAELFSPRQSISIYAQPGEGAKYRPFDLLSSVDAMRHEEDIETTAKRGNLPALDVIVQVANKQGNRQDPYAVGRARRFIQELERERPEVLKAYVEAKGAQS